MAILWTQLLLPDGCTSRYSPCPSQYRPASATVRTNEYWSAFTGCGPRGFDFGFLLRYGNRSTSRALFLVETLTTLYE